MPSSCRFAITRSRPLPMFPPGLLANPNAMNFSRSMLTAASDFKSQIARFSSAASSALRFWLVALAGFSAMAQTGLGQGFTEGLNNSVANVSVSGGAYYTDSSGTGDRPASSPFASEGMYSRGVSNGTATITSNTINTTGGTGISLSFRLASFSIASTGNGADGADTVVVAISPDGGTTYYETLTVAGNSNAYWAYSASGMASTAYDGNASSISFAPGAGGSRITDGLSTVTVTNLPAVASMRFRITMLNNSTSERWVADNIVFSGTFTPTATLTAATLVTALSTTYGTESSGVNFTAAGTNLTGNITATAQTGYEVSTSESSGYTSSVSVASGTQVWVRFAANRAAGNHNNATAVVLSSTGATSVNVATSANGNAVTPKSLSITAGDQTKTYGSALALGTSLFSSVGLANSETIGSVALTSSGSAASAAAGIYSIATSSATGGTFTPGNYTIIYSTGTLTVDPKDLTITANAVTKPFGDTLASPVTGSTAFTSVGLVGSEDIGSVTITYGTGAASGDLAGAYPNQVTPSSAVGGTFDIANYAPTYVSATLTVTADPTITVNGTLTTVSTTYGTASASPANFSVSGIFLTGELTVTPPAGFEVSTIIDSGYTTSLSIPASGTLGNTPVYVRLAAITAFGTYSGNVTVSGGGAAEKTVATVSSLVAKKALMITGLTGGNKPYDRTVAATTTGTAAYVGLGNGESFSVTGTPTASFANATAGIAKAITVSGYTAPSANYSVSQPSGLTGDITPLALTVTGSTVTSRAYDGGAVASITGSTLVGVINPDVVTIATSPGIFADVNAGTGIAVTGALTLGGADAGNYSLIQPTGLIGDITKANQFIAFAALADRVTSDAPFALTATASSGLTVSFASSVPAVASVSGATVTIFSLGTTNITASQAGDGNYHSAVDVIRPLKVSPPILAAWDLFGVSSPATATATIVAANLDSTNTITRGSSAAASTGGNSFRTVGFQNDGISVANNDFFQTTVSAAPGFALSLASIDAAFVGTDTFRASPGVSAQYAYSLDGTTFTLIGSPFSLTANTSMPQISLSAISVLQNVPASTTVTFRYYASGQTTTGGWGYSSPSAGSFGLRFGGAVVVAPSINGAATANAFTTIYRAPSVEQSFPISGANLIADLVATAPTGFEVSADGATYASTATFPPASGSASGSLRIRLAATAPVVGSYDSQNIVLSSTNATPINIVTTSSGNIVSRATTTITTAPTASTITFGQTLASSSLSGGIASQPGTFAFTTPSAAPSVGTASHGVTFTPTDAANYGNATTTANVTVISIYAGWSNGFFPGFTDTATTSNPDNDGLSNLLEFAFGTDPTVSTSGFITYANGVISANGQPTTSITNITNGVDYRAVFGRRKDYLSAGLTYTVQFSAGLDVWVDSTDTPTVMASSTSMDAVSVPYPFFIPTMRGVGKPTFFRVAVTSN